MKKLFIAHLSLTITLCSSYSVYAMSPGQEEFQKVLEMSREEYKQAQQRKIQQEQELMTKLEEESRELEKQRLEKWRRIEDIRMEQALKISEKEFLREQEKNSREIEKIKEKEEGRAEEERIREELIKQFGVNATGADAVVVVNNPFIPVESIEIKENDGTVRKGIARSEARALWEIPIKMANKPFIVSAVLNGKRYQWKVGNFKDYSLELGLIARKTIGGFDIQLYKITETGSSLRRKIIDPFSIQQIK